MLVMGAPIDSACGDGQRAGARIRTAASQRLLFGVAKSCADVAQAVESAKDPEVRARNQRLIKSWQAALPTLFPAIKVNILPCHHKRCSPNAAGRCVL